MNNTSVSNAYHNLKNSAQRRWQEQNKTKTRVVVQIGHCSQAIGATKIAEILAESLPENTYLITAGCDGSCYNSVQVVLTRPSGVQHRYTRITPDSATQIATEISSGSLSGESGKVRFFDKQQRLTLDLCGQIDATNIDDYILHGGYAGLARALDMSADQVIDEVKESGLRGRGGAYFPAAVKWQGARAIDNHPRYLIVNSEEGEPGIFKDRHLMEGVAHRIIEGAIIASYASGVHEAYIYINAEANLSAQRLSDAVELAYGNALLGENILGSGYNLNITIRRGAGGYVCGEETTLINTMEGYRREPRLRPPFPTEAGLWAKPTVINNTETLASVPFILSQGAKEFAAIGTSKNKGTKIISLSGSVQRSGLVEVPMGTTLRQIVYDIGGGLHEGHTLTALAVGGPSSGILPPSMMDTPIAPGLLHESGVMLGAGGIIIVDERMSVIEIVRKLSAYNSAESCGKCTPCREGTPKMVETIDRLMSNHGSGGDLDELKYLAQVVNAASLCGLGQAAGNPINSALHFFKNDLF